MSQYERLVLMAEDELTEYSTQKRKIEKLRRKIGLSVPAAEQREVREQLQTEMSSKGIARIVETQRQTVALPFWGICGLGLLEGFLGQPVGWVAAISGCVAAFSIQRWGWKLQARRLLLQTFEDIDARTAGMK